MLATRKLVGASARYGILQQSARLNRAPWRSAQRQWQWQRKLSSRSQSSKPLHQPPRIAQHLPPQRRYQSQSTTEQAKTAATKAAVGTVIGTANTGSRLIAYIYGTGLVLLLSFAYLYITDTRASLHQYFVVPLIRLVYADAEDAHHAGVRYLKALYHFNMHIRERGNQDKELGDLRVEVFGHILDNPVGTSAGIDKNADVPDALLALGPAVVEVGGATPLPQEGNSKPRVFRIPSQNALINRYGLNSQGAAHVATQLRERVRHFAYSNSLGLGPDSEQIVLDGEAGVPPGSLVPGKLLAVQIAKNKTTPDADIDAVARDYVFCVDHLAKYADILVVNVSSPNTPGLRDLQATAPLTAILSAVVNAAKSVDRKTKPAVMVKVSPDEDTDSQVEGICSAVWASGVDGVIVGNTTKKRPDPLPKGYIMPANEAKTLTEVGGYSGPQMFERTLNLVKRYRSKLDQGPPEEAQNLSRSQQQIQSTLEPSERRAASQLKRGNVDESVKRDQQRLKPLTAEAEQESQQPLFQIPDRHKSNPTQAKSLGEATEAHSISSGSPPNIPPETEGMASSPREAAGGAIKKVLNAAEKPKAAVEKAVSKASPTPSPSPASKVIFATGGITNGEQCLEILNAGASLCQIYTAMMYGGVGTVTRMKTEMREAIKSGIKKD